MNVNTGVDTLVNTRVYSVDGMDPTDTTERTDHVDTVETADPFLTVAEVAALLRMSRQKVYAIAGTELEAHRFGRSIRVLTSAAIAYRDRNRVPVPDTDTPGELAS